MKKKFFVNVHYDVVVPVEVFADSEDNALDLAVDKASYMSLNDCDANYTDSCVTDLALTDEPLTPQKKNVDRPNQSRIDFRRHIPRSFGFHQRRCSIWRPLGKF